MSEFDKHYGERIVTRNIDATTPESAAICQSLGFKNHGLVIRDSTGKTLWSQPDHAVVIEDVRAALDSLLE